MKFTIALSAITGASAIKVDSLLKKEDSWVGGDWITLDNGIEFQAARGVHPPMDYVRKLSASSKEFETNSYAEIFVDGTETHYDEYAQAWRALGFYIDCDAQNYDYYYYDNRDNYKDGQNQADDKENKIGCQRFLLWAAVSYFRKTWETLIWPTTPSDAVE